ncbi:MAG: transglycosylase SLT domain-containing protein [Saprospiraceae bacterium]|nr:transglycosylase SLT domain-containing protein [Saprospiraceae bacterium]
MEPYRLRHLLASLFIFSLFALQTNANTSFNADEIKPRFESMDCVIAPRYTSEVESYIKKHLAYNGSNAKRIMERAAVYFPIYEKYLKEHGLPQDLKYLSIVESSLVPQAVSPAGAKGLWQFMSETGKNYCLTIDNEVDERFCPYNATEAAMQYLAKQFQRFGSWELALASYNCGPGTINNAMKRARSNDYWAISKYLPRETKNFVPAFLGAAYIGNFYHLHGIEPEYPSLDMQVTEAIKVYDKLDFATIASVTGLPVFVVEKLNPAFKKDYVPDNTEGYDVIVPRRTSAALTEYLEARRPDSPRKKDMPEVLPAPADSANYLPAEQYFRSVYVVAEGDKIGELAETFNIAPYNLKVWNKLTSYQLKKGQELTIWFPNEFHHFLPKEEKIEIARVANPATSNATAEGAVATEEVFERDNMPLPNEMPTLKNSTKLQSIVTPNLKVAIAPPASIEPPKTVESRVEKMIAPLKNIKIQLPKPKEKTEKPKPAPAKPSKFAEQNGHGII